MNQIKRIRKLERENTELRNQMIALRAANSTMMEKLNKIAVVLET
jgi:hypothetical protein